MFKKLLKTLVLVQMISLLLLGNSVFATSVEKDQKYFANTSNNVLRGSGPTVTKTVTLYKEKVTVTVQYTKSGGEVVDARITNVSAPYDVQWGNFVVNTKSISTNGMTIQVMVDGKWLNGWGTNIFIYDAPPMYWNLSI